MNYSKEIEEIHEKLLIINSQIDMLFKFIRYKSRIINKLEEKANVCKDDRTK